MRRIFPLIICGLFLLFPAGGEEDHFGALAQTAKKANKEICITFDDLPVVRVPDRIERLMMTDEILFTLEEFGVIAAGFVVGDNIEDDQDILESWLDAGHTLGNHTWSHPDLNDVPPDLFIKDVKKGHDAIEGLLVAIKQKKRYFRYPSLHYGNTIESKETVGDFLAKQNYIIAHVSIDTDDFAYNLQYEKVRQSGDSLMFVQLGNEYIDHILERLEAAEKLADEVMGRPIKHILLLHANRLNSAFLADLLTEFTELGYTFISLDKALSDPVYALPESYVGPKGLSILEKLAQNDPDLLPAREGQ